MSYFPRLQVLCTVLTLLGVFSSCAAFEYFFSVGCYKDDTSNRDLKFKSPVPSAPDSVENCAEACRKEYFRYAGLQNAELCSCGDSYGHFGMGVCDKRCHLNSSQLCGGAVSNSIYDTGQRVPGPPASLEITKVDDSSIQIHWMTPHSTNGIITTYEVSVKYVETYSTSGMLAPLNLIFTNGTDIAELLSLHPATKYNISVAAHNAYGRGVFISKLAWTLVGEPTEPEVPVVIKRDKGQIVIKIIPVVNENGPVSAYQIIVVGEGGHAAFSSEVLTSWTDAQREGQPYYIAAELTPLVLGHLHPVSHQGILDTAAMMQFFSTIYVVIRFVADINCKPIPLFQVYKKQ